MKKIKIFLASSEELKEERKEVADIVTNLNHILSSRDIFVDLVKWEYLDASMGPLEKQEEYNAKLRECELCIVLSSIRSLVPIAYSTVRRKAGFVREAGNEKDRHVPKLRF